jgi:hypothetical protein
VDVSEVSALGRECEERVVGALFAAVFGGGVVGIVLFALGVQPLVCWQGPGRCARMGRSAIPAAVSVSAKW